MDELLENLPANFDKKFKEEAKMTELTRYSVVLSRKSVLVVTNKYLYILKKKFLTIGVNKLPVNELSEVKMSGKKLVISLGGKTVEVSCSRDKEKTAKKLAFKINNQISNLRNK